MRYFTLAYFVAFAFVFAWNTSIQTRKPASYPNFAGVADISEQVAPETRKLGPPTNGNAYSMKNIEDTYTEFKAQNIKIEEQVQIASQRLQYLLTLRNNDRDYNWANSANPLAQAISLEKRRLAYWQGQQQANSLYALNKINLDYAMIQIGLKQESHARVAELTGYISSVHYNSFGDTLMTSRQFFIDPSQPTLFDETLFTTPHFPGTVDRSAEVSDDFIGPRLPEQQQQDFSWPGTVAI
ncbi:hypothetical protein K2X05_08840 [bacterium]|nr:hypothetical protein [bacterium]